MKKPVDKDWDEFHDIEIVDWKRIRSAIEHENTLVNHRLTWLFSSQIFLFAFFGLVFVSWIKKEPDENLAYYVPFVLGAISILAIVICAIIFDALNSARTQIQNLQSWWDGHCGSDNSRHPPIQLWKKKTHVLLRLFWSEFIPIWFLFTWLLLFLAVACNLLQPIKDTVEANGIYIFSGLALLVVIVTLTVTITVRVVRNKGSSD